SSNLQTRLLPLLPTFPYTTLFRSGNRHGAVGGAMDDRDRLAPVALAREHPVAQAIADGPLAQSALFQPGGDLLLGFGGGQPVEEIGRANDFTPCTSGSLMLSSD